MSEDRAPSWTPTTPNQGPGADAVDRDEEILDPELPICDAHHHLWDIPGSRYVLSDFELDKGAGHRIVNSVAIECKASYLADGPEPFRPIGETQFVVAADPGASIGGIVGYADLRAREVRDVLAAHVDAGQGRFRGVRNTSGWDADPAIVKVGGHPAGLLGDPAFRSGFAALGQAGLSFDAWMWHTQIDELTDLASAFPEVPIVLDHLGTPLELGPYLGHRQEVQQAWRHAIERLSRCPNVMMKLGGMSLPRLGSTDQLHGEDASSTSLAARWKDNFHWCVEHFGVDRCMLESNFPVESELCSYKTVWNTFKRIFKDASPHEKAALFHDTAVTFYRL